jgi:hypothetical protein
MLHIISPNFYKNLSISPDPDVRATMAMDPKLPLYLLKNFSNDEDFYVRCMVSRNPNATTHILKNLSEDKDERVRVFSSFNDKSKQEWYINSSDTLFFFYFNKKQELSDLCHNAMLAHAIVDPNNEKIKIYLETYYV